MVACFVTTSGAAEVDDTEYMNWMTLMNEKVEDGELDLMVQQTSDVGDVASMGMQASSDGRTIVVDKSGKGDFKKIQQAVDSIPVGNKKRVTIHINNGVYRCVEL